MAKSIYLAVQINNPKYPGSPYVVFVDLRQDNLPKYHGGRDTRDLITWYKDSIISKPNIRKILVQASVDSEYEVPNDMVVSRVIFPKFNSISASFKFFSNTMACLFFSLIGVIRGKWWFGILIAESINLNYVKFLKKELLAEEYYFTNSNWFYKPLWTYEVENNKKLISQLYYSTNIDPVICNDYYCNDYKGYQIMKWKHFIVWDQVQEDFLKEYCPNSKYIKVGYVDITGLSKNYHSVNGKKILSIFDVTPIRPITLSKMGYAIPQYYSEELNIKFIQDIKELFSDEKWIILWKPKRIVGTLIISEAFKRKQSKLINGNLIKVDPGIAASSLVETSDAVISMPFTSPSVIAKFKDIPCIFYDTSGSVKNEKNHGIPLLRGKDELKEWSLSLTKGQR